MYQHKHFNYLDWAIHNKVVRACQHCGREFNPASPRQWLCTREDNPACDDDIWLEKLWEKGKHPLLAHIENL